MKFCEKVFFVSVFIEVLLLLEAAGSSTESGGLPIHSSSRFDEVHRYAFMELGEERRGLPGGTDWGIFSLSECDPLVFTFSVQSNWISGLSIANSSQAFRSSKHFTNPNSFTLAEPITKIECQMTSFFTTISVFKSLRIHTENGFHTIGNWDDKDSAIQSTADNITISILSMHASDGIIDSLGVYYSYGKSIPCRIVPDDNTVKIHVPLLPVDREIHSIEIGNEHVEYGKERFPYGNDHVELGYVGSYLLFRCSTLELTGYGPIKFEYVLGPGHQGVIMMYSLAISNGRHTIKTESTSTFHNSFTVSSPISKIECQLGGWDHSTMKNLRIHSKSGSIYAIGDWNQSDANIKSTPDGITILSLSLRYWRSVDAIVVKYIVNT